MSPVENDLSQSLISYAAEKTILQKCFKMFLVHLTINLTHGKWSYDAPLVTTRQIYC